MPIKTPNILLFLEPSQDTWLTPLNIGHLFVNRFAIDEDAGFEIQGIHFLRESSFKMSNPEEKEYPDFALKRTEKEAFDFEVFNAGIEKLNGIDSKIHLIYAGCYYDEHLNMMKSFLVEIMAKYKILSLVVTLLRLGRFHVITKETMIDFYKGRMSDSKGDKESANEDLESFFGRLQHGVHIHEEEQVTYFLPKLSEIEVKLLEEENEEYLKSFGWYYRGEHPDVDEDEMEKSESKSKFVRALCVRHTFELSPPVPYMKKSNTQTCCKFQLQ